MEGNDNNRQSAPKKRANELNKDDDMPAKIAKYRLIQTVKESEIDDEKNDILEEITVPFTIVDKDTEEIVVDIEEWKNFKFDKREENNIDLHVLGSALYFQQLVRKQIRNNPNVIIDNREFISKLSKETGIDDIIKLLNAYVKHLNSVKNNVELVIANHNSKLKRRITQDITQFREKLIATYGESLPCFCSVCQSRFIDEEGTILECNHFLCFPCEKSLFTTIPNTASISIHIRKKNVCYLQCPVCRKEYILESESKLWKSI